MKQFSIVLKFELSTYFKNKSFLVTTLILAFVIAAVVVVPTMIPGVLGEKAEATDNVSEEELEQLGLCLGEEAGISSETIETVYPAKWTVYETEAEMKQAVEQGDIEAGFVLRSPEQVVYVVNDLSMYDSLGEVFTQMLTTYYKQQYLIEKGLTPEEIAEAETQSVQVTKEVLGKDGGQNYWYTYVLVFVVYFLIIFYGQMIATSVTTEKSNRAIEILVTSVNPTSLICGKVLAGAVAGVLQAGIILGSGFISYGCVKESWGGMLDFLFDVPTDVMVIYVIFAVLSYLLYAFIFGMLGALVSKTEDISKSSGPVMMVYIVSFFIAIIGMSGDSNSILMKVASYVPFTSGNAMFVRVAMGSVNLWEVWISGMLLVAGCVLAGILAAKIFRFGTLHYGNPIQLKTALKKIKQER